jgi:hypothetical protein
MRLNLARHALSTCICDTLYNMGVTYSMPAFLGNRQPAGPLSSSLGAESSRPMTGTQVPSDPTNAMQCDQMAKL